jgi:hypothetical protein
MRLHKHLHILATAATVAAVSAPVAHAEAISNGGGGGPFTNPHLAPVSHPAGSTDWPLIALAGGGTFVLVGAGLGGARRRSTRRASTGQAGAPHVA